MAQLAPSFPNAKKPLPQICNNDLDSIIGTIPSCQLRDMPIPRSSLDTKVVAMFGNLLDRFLACGVNVNMVVRTTGCMNSAISACKQIGYRYIVS